MSKKSKYKLNLRTIGNILIFFSLSVIFLTFYPIIKEELLYNLKRLQNISYKVVDKNEDNQIQNNKKIKILVPPNTDFSIVIPKIEALAPIIAEVDYTDSQKFLPALKKGVAHAMGTSYPDELGNVYIFAHSTDTFYNVNYFNAVFYLLGKLKQGDEIYIYYKGDKYIYSVDDVRVVLKDDTYYLGKISDKKTLTLQTCYPPGTTLKRLVVVANLSQ